MSLYNELKRRHVFKVAIAYILLAWLVMQVADVVLNNITAPGWVFHVLLLFLALGFPLAVFFAWAFQITPGGVIRTQIGLDGSKHEGATGDDGDNSSLNTDALTSVAKTSNRISIVVLPFDNLSPDPGDAYFSDGLTEEIIANLAYLRSLRVISRSTAAVLKDSQKDVQTIGQDLDVQYVLEGSVRKAGDSLRITAQLIEAKSDEHVWVEQHDGTMGDIFAVQEKIAKRLVEALKLELSPPEEKRLVDRPITDPKAYQIWIEAVQEAQRFSVKGAQRGIQLAEQVLQITKDNTHVYALLAYLHWQAFDFGGAFHERTLDLGEAYASKALELDPTLPMALLAKGLIRYKRGDIPGFVRHARPAAELGSDSEAPTILAFVLAEVGKLDEAQHYADEAVAADPLIFLPWLVQSNLKLFKGNSGAALEQVRDARNRFAPEEPFAAWWVAQTAAYAGDEAEAHDVCSAAARMDGGLFAGYCELFRRALEKDSNGVMELLDNAELTEPAKADEMYPLFLANTLAHIGDHDAALLWLERSINWGFSNHCFLTEHDRFLTPLRGDQRFRTLIKLAQEKQKNFDV